MTTPARIKLLILDRPTRMGERRLAEMIVAEGRVVKNKWGGLTVGEMRLTPTEREKVLHAMGQSEQPTSAPGVPGVQLSTTI